MNHSSLRLKKGMSYVMWSSRPALRCSLDSMNSKVARCLEGVAELSSDSKCSKPFVS
jgi:hypothetical protein